MRQSKVLLAGGLVLAAAAFAGSARADDGTKASTEPAVVGTTIRTCVSLSKGSLRVLSVGPSDLHWKKAPATCKVGEQELDWTVGGGGGGGVGPTGDKGPTGLAGAKGATGAAGTKGPNGAQGTNGTNGTNGTMVLTVRRAEWCRRQKAPMVLTGARTAPRHEWC